MKNYLLAAITALILFAFGCDRKPNLAPGLASEATDVENPDILTNEDDKFLSGWHPASHSPNMIVGKQSFVSSLTPEAWFRQPVGAVDLGSIAKREDALGIIAFGGGLTAGMSNGALNMEGQNFAYPRLVAHQMGMKEFQTPFLKPSEENGIGMYVYAQNETGYPRWNQVDNNLVKVSSSSAEALEPFKGKINNYAFPNGGTWALDTENPYKSRLLPNPTAPGSMNINYIQSIQPYNFVFMEDFFDNFVVWVTRQERLDGRFYGASLNTHNIPSYGMKRAINAGQKGVVFTIPHFKDLLYLNWYSSEQLQKKASSISITYNLDGKTLVIDGSKPFFLKPTPAVETSFQNLKDGEGVVANLSDSDVIDNGEIWFMNPDMIYNPGIKKFAAENNLAIVDLRELYEKIHRGEYFTEDGLKIAGSAKGNFFSSDGIYPTPLGQAVIANEVIKAINYTYNSRIPLIKIKEFAKTVHLKE